MKQFIVINEETANECCAWSGGSPGTAPPGCSALTARHDPLRSRLWGHASSGGLRRSLDRLSAAFFGPIRKTLCPIAFRTLRGGFYVSSGPRRRDRLTPSLLFLPQSFQFQRRRAAGCAAQPSPSSHGPCGVVIAFLDDFLFKSAVLLIFQMK